MIIGPYSPREHHGQYPGTCSVRHRSSGDDLLVNDKRQPSHVAVNPGRPGFSSTDSRVIIALAPVLQWNFKFSEDLTSFVSDSQQLYLRIEREQIQQQLSKKEQ